MHFLTKCTTYKTKTVQSIYPNPDPHPRAEFTHTNAVPAHIYYIVNTGDNESKTSLDLSTVYSFVLGHGHV